MAKLTFSTWSAPSLKARPTDRTCLYLRCVQIYVCHLECCCFCDTRSTCSSFPLSQRRPFFEKRGQFYGAVFSTAFSTTSFGRVHISKPKLMIELPPTSTTAILAFCILPATYFHHGIDSHCSKSSSTQCQCYGSTNHDAVSSNQAFARSNDDRDASSLCTTNFAQQTSLCPSQSNTRSSSTSEQRTSKEDSQD